MRRWLSFLDEGDYNAPPEDTIFIFKSVNVITGITSGDHFLVPAAFLSDLANNYDFTYVAGIMYH